MISQEKVRKFMWFSLGIAISLSLLYVLQKMFGSGS
jgi:hypothetical protein